MLERIEDQSGVVYYRSPLLARAGVKHAFSTRLGGTSTGSFDSMNLGNPLGMPVQDDLQRIEQNYTILQKAIGLDGYVRCWVHQVHGGRVVMIRSGDQFNNGSEKADALLTDDPRRMLAVRVADCAPILLSSENGKVVAAVHAGWRGVISNVVGNAIDQMGKLTQAPLLAAIGPCIGGESFEVGPEVLGQFNTLFRKESPVSREENGKGYVDISRGIKLQLVRAGLAEDRIDLSDRCTFRDRGEFFSHRREHGQTGRMAALIAAH